MNYYQPDITWESFRVKSRDEFVEQFVIISRFHSDVHEDIKKSYETVERMMALSYYHYKLYDEAYKKLFGMFEMSVKFRCESLNISLTASKFGKDAPKDLSVLIDQLIKKGVAKEFKTSLHHIRKMRNHYSHPNQHSFGGGIFKNGIIPILNIINDIFRPLSYFADKKKEINRIKRDLMSLNEELIIYKPAEKPFLMYGLKPSELVNVNGDWWHLWSLKPVMQVDKDMSYRNSQGMPIMLILKDELITDSGLSAIEYYSKDKIELIITKKDENRATYDSFKSHLNSFDIMDTLGKDLIWRDFNEQMYRFIYDHS